MPTVAPPEGQEAGGDGAGGGFNPFEAIGGLFGLSGPGAGSSDDDTPSGKRGRQPAASKVRQAREHVSRLLTIVDSLVVQTIDPLEMMPPGMSPAMRPKERELIEEPLADIIAESKQLAKIAGVSSMLSLSVGCSMWGWRVFAAWRYKQMAEQVARDIAGGVGVGPVVSAPAVDWPPIPEMNKPQYSFVPEAPEMHSDNGMSDPSSYANADTTNQTGQ